jgi:ethanolamine ammonia-lyase small subunit
MADPIDDTPVVPTWPDFVRQVRVRTPARLLVGRAGAAYSTNTQLELRESHAAARDAVRSELDIRTTFSDEFRREWRLFEVSTRAKNKEEYLHRPDLGRHFDDSARAEILARCRTASDLQIAIGDGLSVPAVAVQVPPLLPLLSCDAVRRNWTVGQIFVIRYCRVGILNEIGELLRPTVAVLLIGERPGLATVESLSAYMAYQPTAAHTDANRNLVSNIHARGLATDQAATSILNTSERMMIAKTSGYRLGDRNPQARTLQGVEFEPPSTPE